MKIFSGNNRDGRRVEPDLVSLHIYKTAGTSFAEILKQVYGRKAIHTLHIQKVGDDETGRVTFDDKIIPGHQLPFTRPVVHGHYAFKALQRLWPAATEVRMITWLRHPVRRVESAFRYVNSIYKDQLSNTHPQLNILNTLKRNRMEYAAAAINRNVMSKMLQGASLEDFKFVGVVEHFEEDLIYLSKMLGWRDFTIPHSNRTLSQQPPLEPFKEQAIAAWNQEDMDLYEQALALRAKRT